MVKFDCPLCDAKCRIVEPDQNPLQKDDSLRHKISRCGHCKREVIGEPLEDNTFPEFETEHKRTLISKDHKFLSKTLMGSVGVEVVKTYWRMLKYECHCLGYEQRMPELLSIIQGDQSASAKRIRKMPDLLLYDQISQKTLLVEVKTRPSDLYLSEYEIEQYSSFFPEAYVAFMQPSEPEIRVASISDLNKLTPKSTKNFGNGKCRVWEAKQILRPYELAESNPVFRRIAKVDHEVALRHVSGAIKDFGRDT